MCQCYNSVPEYTFAYINYRGTTAYRSEIISIVRTPIFTKLQKIELYTAN